MTKLEAVVRGLPKLARAWAPALMTFALTMTLTSIVVTNVRRELSERMRGEFVVLGQSISNELADGLRYFEQALASGAALRAVISEPTRSQWNTFADTLGLSYAGVQGLGFARYLSGSYADFEAEQRRSGRLDFRVHPAGPRENYAIIEFLAPEDDRNRTAIGYDMMSEDVRREALVRARDTGETTISGPVRLVQEIDEDVQVGVLMYRPVYDSAAGTGTSRALIGYVYAPFRMRNLIARSLQPYASVRDQFKFKLVDRVLGQDKPLHSDAGFPGSSWFGKEYMLNAKGRQWAARFEPTDAYFAKFDVNSPTRTFLIGLIASALVSAIVGLLTTRQAAALRNATDLAQEVERRKQSERSLRLSNRELIHRVKNTLAIVTSIATQTARHTTSMGEFQSAFRQRVNALGRVHDMLRAEHAFTPDFQSLVRQTLAPYVNDLQTALSTSGPTIAISQDQAVMYALIFNELATNATKHGAWTGRNGKVAITWSLDAEPGAADSRFVIRWSESGGPIVKPPQRRGFGTALATFAVERTLKGRLNFDFQPSGVVATIELPWTAATAAGAESSWQGLQDKTVTSDPRQTTSDSAAQSSRLQN